MRRILPSAVAGLLLIVILYGILAALGASIAIAATRFANELTKPAYTSTFTGFVTDIQQLLAERGVETEEINDAINNFDLRNLAGVASSLANTVTGLTTTMLFLLTVMIFLVMDAGGFGRRLDAIHRQKPDVADASSTSATACAGTGSSPRSSASSSRSSTTSPWPGSASRWR